MILRKFAGYHRLMWMTKKDGFDLEKKRKHKKFGCLFICALIFLFGCQERRKEPGVENSMRQNPVQESAEYDNSMQENPGVKVTFFDVGKGDAILIETREYTLLIDAGYDKTYGVIRDYLAKQEIEKLDYLVITHFDKDHVGGADRVVSEFEVGEILQPDYASDGGQYQEYRAVLEEKKLQPVLVTESMQFSLDGADFYIYPPQKKTYEEEDNDFSLTVSMAYGERSFLFAGDCEEERLDELLLQTEFDLSHDVLKVPHHGKKEDNSREFLERVAPEAAVITCSSEEPASKKLCNMLDELGTQVYLTSDGTVTCLCDGKNLEMSVAP